MDCWDTLERFQKVMGGTWSRYIQKQVVLLNVKVRMTCCPRAPNVAPQKLTRFCTLAGLQTSSTWTQTVILAASDIYSPRAFDSARFCVRASPW